MQKNMVHGASEVRKAMGQIIEKKLKKGLSVSEIAEFLEISEEEVIKVRDKELQLV